MWKGPKHSLFYTEQSVLSVHHEVLSFNLHLGNRHKWRHLKFRNILQLIMLKNLS